VQQHQQECGERLDALADAPGVLDPGDAAPALAAFTPAERRRLWYLRRLVARGERSDAYPVDKRQDFVRWLVDQGKLSDN
jgi:hypothetical protein